MAKPKRNIAVSKLASYAEDPVRFCKLRGGVASRKAVRVGDQAHYDAGVGSATRLAGRLAQAAVIAVILAGAIYYALGL